MPPSLPPPSIPTQFARPVPAQYQPSPADVLNRPGPYGAQPQSAPRVGPPTSLPPGTSVPAAAGGASAAGGGVVLPAAILAVPLAIGMGETGNPILSNQQEKAALERARAGGMPDPFAPFRPAPLKPGTPGPTNPPPAPKRPNAPRGPAPSRPGFPGTWQLVITTSYAAGTSVDPWSFPGTSGDIFGTIVAANGTSITKNGQPVLFWSLPLSQGGGTATINSQVFTPTPRPGPPNPAPPLGPPGRPAPNRPPLPNPQNNPGPPNPAQPPGSSLPDLPNPTNPAPINPNPTRPGPPAQPGVPNPTNPTPVNPNPTLPAPTNPAPTNPSQPTTTNPSLPNPSVPGPIVPSVPGPIVPSVPGPIVPSVPNPIGPSNPLPNPCIDPCITVTIDRLKPVNIRVKRFASCDRKLFGIPAPFNYELISVPAAFSNVFQTMIDNQADILEAIECKECDEPIAVVPDWWPLRLGANRAQLLVSYARKFNNGKWDSPKYLVSIPHWNKSESQTKKEDFPTFSKGQYQGSIVFPDNAKLIVNCSSPPECDRVLSLISASINPVMLQDSETTISERRGNPLRQITIFPRVARYFSSGQANLEPDWILKF